jgi:hypothetical protein
LNACKISWKKQIKRNAERPRRERLERQKKNLKLFVKPKGTANC